MCGRFGLFTDLIELVELLGFEIRKSDDLYAPSWNIAPTSSVLTITESDGDRTGSMMRWGLVPSWANPETALKHSMFNARSETVAERPMFRDSFLKRRCLVPADGFYEWQHRQLGGGTGENTPMWIHNIDDQVITFAGIWSAWRGPDRIVESCAILTTTPNSLMSPIHDRMPVILDDDWAKIWLDDAADQTILLEALKTREWDKMTAQEANPAVGSTKNDGPYLLEPQRRLF